jgi:circadian clock protein KaiB
MSSKSPKKPRAAKPVAELSRPKVCLFVAGNSPKSERARANLFELTAKLGSSLQDHDVEIIDVFVEPMRALKERVMATPTLLVEGREATGVLIGDLSDTEMLTNFLKTALEKRF